MFGSGLESLPLVRNMLWEDASPYRPVKLFPGKEGQLSCVQYGVTGPQQHTELSKEE